MPKKKKPEIEDPTGEEWQAEAETRWSEAVARAEKEEASPLDFYRAPELPDFAAMKSAAVQGDVFGRFVVAGGLIHDVTRAEKACRVDETLPRTFVHFAHELDAAAGDASPHAECMG